MRVESIMVNGIMGLTHASVSFPDSGIVLVQGPNGSGKSSLIEAVSMACYGKGVRAKSAWNAQNETPELRIMLAELPGDSIHRYGPGGPRVKLSSTRHLLNYESTTHAQDALNKLLPLTWRQWRKSCVLSSSDSGAFTLASDADRKRVIEDIIGMSELDKAHKKALENFRKKQTELSQTKHALSLVRTRIEEVHKRLRDGLPPEDLAPPLTDAERSEHSQTEIALKSASGDAEAAQKALIKEQSQGMVAGEAQLLDLRTQKKRIGGGKCPTCGQAVGEELLSHLYARIQTLALKVEEAKTSHEDRIALLKEEATSLAEESRGYRLEVEQNKRRALEAEHAEMWGKRAESIAAEAGRDLAEAKTESIVLEAQIHEQSEELKVLGGVVQTLSTRGVRSMLVGRTTRALQEAANYWLSRLGGGLTVEISPYTEKKDGSAKEAISLTYSKNKSQAAESAVLSFDEEDTPVLPPNDAVMGLPYASASGGERRRIDIAITLAMGQVSEGAHGKGSSTLFCDEIFDALDADGMEGAVNILQELSQDRVVVVITHHATDALVRCATTTLSVKNGAVSSFPVRGA